MKIYHVNSVTKEFIYRDKQSITEGREHPIRKGTYILPANASFVPPPPYKIGYATVLKDGDWVYVEDHRKKSFWTKDGKKVQVTLGYDISDLLTDPPKQVIEEQQKRTNQECLSVLRAIRDYALKEYCDKFIAINFWDGSNEEKIQEWKEYRLKLLSATENEEILLHLEGKIKQYQKNRDIFEVIPKPPEF